MKKLYVAGEFQGASGRYHIQCEDLVGTGRNWIEPARILGLQPVDFIVLLRSQYNAEIEPYKKDGKLSWIGYSWTNLADARKFKNMLNERARKKQHFI